MLQTKYSQKTIREQFPIFAKPGRDRPLIYLDSAATSMKPECVIEAMSKYYRENGANVHRGVYRTSEEASAAFEAVREKVASFIGAANRDEIVFTRGTTESINLVASCFSRRYLCQDDNILLTRMEHHANIVPWHIAAEQIRFGIREIPVDDRGELVLDRIDELLDQRIALVGVTLASNVLGTINPLEVIISKAHERGIPVLVDAAQAIAHIPIDVQRMPCDFLAFSGHKMFGPNGVGVLYGRYKMLASLPPYMGGGNTIVSVSMKKTNFAKPPMRFEAGTPPIAEVIGLGAAIDFIEEIGYPCFREEETILVDYLLDQLRHFDGLTILGDPLNRVPVVAFNLDRIHPHDVGTLLDEHGIAIRAGHHCAQPLLERFDLSGCCRVSLSIYNTREDVDRFIDGLLYVRGVIL